MSLPGYISALLDEQGHPTQLLSLGCLVARNTPKIIRWPAPWTRNYSPARSTFPCLNCPERRGVPEVMRLRAEWTLIADLGDDWIRIAAASAGMFCGQAMTAGRQLHRRRRRRTRLRGR